jgi:hypothetical protein
MERRSTMSREDQDQLLNVLLPHAQELLKKYGEFYPFAASLTTDGQVELHAGYSGEEKPPSQEIIDLLVEGLRSEAQEGRFRAAGICFDVRVQPPDGQAKTDAVAVTLEHQAGDAVCVYLPYRKRFLGKIAYGDLFATAEDPQIFVGGSHGPSQV